MDISIKKEKVNESKKKLIELIDETINNTNNNIIQLNKEIDRHNELIDFLNKTHIFQQYYWESIKMDYNIIRKKVTQDKKKYKIITKLYGNIISYYSNNEINEINLRIANIKDMIDKMIFDKIILNKIHTNTRLKCASINNNILKIELLSDNIKPIMNKLYNNYDQMKLLNKNLGQLKTQKNKLKYEIYNLDNKKII